MMYDYASLNNLSIVARYRYNSEIRNSINGYWLNIFDFQKSIKNNTNYNNYPEIINEVYDRFPIFYNCTIEYKFNNIVEILEWNNGRIINIIHYKYTIIE